jgi:tRNA A-37 threonylcarbamoyl transferase component Bud32
MTPGIWQKIDELFDAALQKDPSQRDTWLRQVCGDDDSLYSELVRLLEHDAKADRNGLFTPPSPLEPVRPDTGSWPSPLNGSARLSDKADTRRAARSARGARAARKVPSSAILTNVDDDSGGFTPVAAIAGCETSRASGETQPVIQARLSELCLIYALIFGMLLLLRPFILGRGDLLVSATIGVVVTGLLGVSIWLRSGQKLALRRLRQIEFAVTGALAAVVVFYEYRNLLARSLEGDPVRAQMVMKNVLLLITILILTYGIYVPKCIRRAAMLSFPLALLPMCTLVVLYLQQPEAMAWLEWYRHGRVVSFVLYGLDALFLLTLAAVSTYGAHMLSHLRREVVEARQLGQYRLRRRIGSGGMGDVYLAEHQLLKRPCAIKLVRPDNVTDPKALERFEREVRITATLSHPNTVEIFDYGQTEDGMYYYVMEYLPGLSLADLVEQHGPLPPERAVYLLRQVCLALHEAHDAGLIHRDIKPSNIHAARRGGMDDVAKLLDFGLVRPGATIRESAVSAEGQILGTPLYMSPEQAMGSRDLDSRTDIYSLGAVAYFLLTGRPPFNQSSGIAAMIAHARDPVEPPSRHRSGIPKDLETVILRCLAKSPADRFIDADELEQALGECECADSWDKRRASEWWLSMHAPSGSMAEPVSALQG